MELVTAQRQQVDGNLGQIHGDPANGLNGIGVEPHTVGTAHRTNVRNGLNNPGFVVGPHHADQRGVVGVRGNGIFDHLGPHDATVVNREVDQLAAAKSSQTLHTLANGSMLHFGHQHSAPIGKRIKCSRNRKII